MRTLWIIIIASISLNYSFAANDNTPAGAQSAGIGNASVALYDFWAIQNNQAGLSQINNISAGFYFENRFLIKDLGICFGAFVLPTKSGVFGLSVKYFGNKLYNETKAGLAYSRSFGEHFSAGIQLDYFSTNIGENYGSKNLISFEAGIITKINEQLNIAAHVFNPIRIMFNDYNNERIPTILKFGLSYKFSDKLQTMLETEKDIDKKAIFKAGIEYRIIEKIYVRGGITSDPTLYTFGFGINFKKLKIDFASSMHQTLGYSPQISIVYTFK
ncbi:MAG: hypothetical protein JEY97_02175 [Bacteroidales bacterium]|nr:hypothetical protein [Bacteroidales bacterium]